MAENFDVEAAQRAMRNAEAKIQELVSNRKKESETVESNFGQDVATGSALGGAVGEAANAAYQSGSNFDFSELSSKMESFMTNRVEEIVKNSTNMSNEAESFYSNVQ